MRLVGALIFWIYRLNWVSPGCFTRTLESLLFLLTSFASFHFFASGPFLKILSWARAQDSIPHLWLRLSYDQIPAKSPSDWCHIFWLFHIYLMWFIALASRRQEKWQMIKNVWVICFNILWKKSHWRCDCEVRFKIHPCNVQCAICNVQSSMCNLQCAMYIQRRGV